MKVSGVSYSSDRKLARCEMQYSYRYDQKLKPRVKKKGLFLGDWMHQMQEAWRRRENWEAILERLIEEQWDKLFDEEKEMYNEGFKLPFPEHARDLMTHYDEYWRDQRDEWKNVEIEVSHALMTKLGFPYRWKSDWIVREGRMNILVETKNKKKIPDSEERIMAPQTHGYCFMARKVGIEIHKIIWDYVRTSPVPRPELTKKGEISKRKINTDQRQYLAFLKENKIHPQSEEERIGIENKLKELPETLTLKRISNTPNFALGEKFVRDQIERARRAREIRRPLRTFTRNCKWDCDYFSLCQIDMLEQSDRSMEIKKNFVRIGDIK